MTGLPESLVPHPDTGELLIAESARELARELVAIEQSIREHRAEARRLDELAAPLRRAITDFVGVDQALDIDDRRTLAVVAGTPGRATVNKTAAAVYAEQLLAVGLGKTETVYKAPTLAEIRAHRAEVVSAGVPLDALIQDGVPGPPRIEIVEKDS